MFVEARSQIYTKQFQQVLSMINATQQGFLIVAENELSWRDNLISVSGASGQTVYDRRTQFDSAIAKWLKLNEKHYKSAETNPDHQLRHNFSDYDGDSTPD